MTKWNTLSRRLSWGTPRGPLLQKGGRYTPGNVLSTTNTSGLGTKVFEFKLLDTRFRFPLLLRLRRKRRIRKSIYLCPITIEKQGGTVDKRFGKGVKKVDGEYPLSRFRIREV